MIDRRTFLEFCAGTPFVSWIAPAFKPYPYFKFTPDLFKKIQAMEAEQCICRPIGMLVHTHENCPLRCESMMDESIHEDSIRCYKTRGHSGGHYGDACGRCHLSKEEDPTPNCSATACWGFDS